MSIQFQRSYRHRRSSSSSLECRQNFPFQKTARLLEPLFDECVCVCVCVCAIFFDFIRSVLFFLRAKIFPIEFMANWIEIESLNFHSLMQSTDRTGIKMYVRLYIFFFRSRFYFHRIFQVLCSTTMWGNASEYVIYGLKLVFSPVSTCKLLAPKHFVWPCHNFVCVCVFFRSFVLFARATCIHHRRWNPIRIWGAEQRKKCLECPAYHAILILCFKAPRLTLCAIDRTVRIEQTTDRHNEHQLMKFTSKCNAVNTQRNVKSAREYSIDVYSMAKDLKPENEWK